MLIAQLNVHGAQYQVRVRNLSQKGAFIEAPVNYNVGTSVILCRAGLEIGAVVARTDAKGLGLLFDDPLDEPSFEAMRTGKAAPKRVAPLPAADAAADPTNLALEARVAAELKYAQRLLDFVTEPLVNDYILINQYGRNLQEIDRLRQLLGHLADVLEAGDKNEAIKRVGIYELRCRLLGEPLLKTWSDVDDN